MGKDKAMKMHNGFLNKIAATEISQNKISQWTSVSSRKVRAFL